VATLKRLLVRLQTAAGQLSGDEASSLSLR
jgi:hypothetical protein